MQKKAIILIGCYNNCCKCTAPDVQFKWRQPPDIWLNTPPKYDDTQNQLFKIQMWITKLININLCAAEWCMLAARAPSGCSYHFWSFDIKVIYISLFGEFQLFSTAALPVGMTEDEQQGKWSLLITFLSEGELPHSLNFTQSYSKFREGGSLASWLHSIESNQQMRVRRLLHFKCIKDIQWIMRDVRWYEWWCTEPDDYRVCFCFKCWHILNVGRHTGNHRESQYCKVMFGQINGRMKHLTHISVRQKVIPKRHL